MALSNGIHHLTILTADIDRLVGFYRRVFDADVNLDLEEDGLRHAFIELGPHTVLHPFQVPGVDVAQGGIPMFGRGRLDHFALNAPSEEAFEEMRRRVVAEGASRGEVTDMGSLLIFTFADPDGAENEVVWMKPGVPVEQTLPRSQWTTADLP